jgi:hypothetical protein
MGDPNERLLKWEWGLAMLKNRDRMNACIHMTPVRWSPITLAVQEEVDELRRELQSTFERDLVKDALMEGR